MFWQRSMIDNRGRIILPLQLRQYLKVSAGDEILWIDCKPRNGKSNEYVIEVAIDNQEAKK